MISLILGLGSTILVLLSGAYFIGQISAIINIMRAGTSSNTKLLWVIITIFLPFGWVIYYAIGRERKGKL